MSKEQLQKEIDGMYKSKAYSFKILSDSPHFNTTSDVKLECMNCGLKQETTVRYLKTGRKSCKCANSGSNLEFIVRIVLTALDIKFKPEYIFTDIDGVAPPRYDFGIYTENGFKLIECDGIQHFEPTFEETSFDITERTDKTKNEYATQNNIPLLRINYKQSEKEVIQKTIEFIKS